MRTIAVALLAGAVIAAPAASQDREIQAPPRISAIPASWAPVPFRSGERLEYVVKFGKVKVGSGAMEIHAMDTVRGQPTWHTVFTVRGGTFFYRVNDRMESWLDVRNLSTLRYAQDLHEGSRSRERRFEIFPDSGFFLEEGKPEPQPTVEMPLDDGAFLYFLRTIPLEVGATYDFDRYFKPDRNPVRIQVLRRERIRVPAGEFDAIVVRPIIKAKGIFSENGRAEVWLSDDSHRIMLQMKSKLSFGSLNLYLKSVRTAQPAIPVVTTAETK